jgi:hypothetical protein
MLARKMVVAVLLATSVGGLAWAADGAKPDKRVDEKRIVEKHVVHGPMGHASVEFAAMHNIMAELLSAKTGKTPAEIAALFDAGGPHEVVDTLNLSEDDMRATFKEARNTLITRAAAANLITSAQAEKLRAAKIEMHHKRVGRDGHDEGDDD